MKNNLSTSVAEQGYAILEKVFTTAEIAQITEAIATTQSVETFATRCFLQKNPALPALLFNDALQQILQQFGEGYQLVKAIYFDKPSQSNWIVNWHQDLTIAVKERVETDGFVHWLPKQGYFSVQPPQTFLDNILTVRIHLDDCRKENGALRVLPASHKTIENVKNLPATFFEQEVVCEVPKGGVLLMKPLIWHTSKRTENQQNRRVIHLEFSNLALPAPLVWSEA